MNTPIQSGDYIQITYKLVRPVETGELWRERALENKRNNLWWASNNANNDNMIVVCTDEWNAVMRVSQISYLEYKPQ